MREVTAPTLGLQASTVNSLPKRRKFRHAIPLEISGLPRRVYFIVIYPDGSSWLYCRRRSKGDKRGRSHMLREPEPSWAIAEVALSAGRKLGCAGVRVDDVSTGVSYETSYSSMDEYGERIRHPGFEPQRRLALRYWTLGQESVVSEQLVLFSQEGAP